MKVSDARKIERYIGRDGDFSGRQTGPAPKDTPPVVMYSMG